MGAGVAAYDLSDEKLLLQLIAQGDQPAFRIFFNSYQSRIFTFVLNFVNSKADAEEIVQETFLDIWQNRIRLTDIEHPRNYIYTIARNKTYRFISNAGRDEKLMKQLWENMQHETNPVEDMLYMHESNRLIQDAVAMLPEKKRQIFMMSRDTGLSHEKISAETGLSKSRVKNIITETLKFIKDHLAQTLTLLMGFFIR